MARKPANTKDKLATMRREAEKARCMVCGERVTVEDRCEDGNYLHRACGYETSTRST